jgi:hypothetical protein
MKPIGKPEVQVFAQQGRKSANFVPKDFAERVVRAEGQNFARAVPRILSSRVYSTGPHCQFDGVIRPKSYQLATCPNSHGCLPTDEFLDQSAVWPNPDRRAKCGGARHHKDPIAH